MQFLNSIISIYRPHYARKLVSLLAVQKDHPGKFLLKFWLTQNYSAIATVVGLSTFEAMLLRVLWIGMTAQILAGVVLIVLGFTHTMTGGIWFGLAILVAYPVIWAHVLAAVVLVRDIGFWLSHPKKLGRELVCLVLEAQVRRLRAAHRFTVVAVAGSVGKTSTKLAIADLLAKTKGVRWHLVNYNDRVTVPLVLFGRTEPNILNIFAWLKIFSANARTIKRPFPYDVVVVELGTDGPGQLRQFAYLQPDLAVVTAVSAEHMEFFKTMEAVAAEELSVGDFSKQMLVGVDDIAPQYLEGRSFKSYSTVHQLADYSAKATSKTLRGQHLEITLPKATIEADVGYIGRQGAAFALAAAAVADELGIKKQDIAEGISRLKHFAGRMQILTGINDSTLIDDTYNASPVAVKAALDVLYAAKASQRIALLGNMNELGDHSASAHKEVGEYCDPKKLDFVVTLGRDADKYLASAAKAQGCEVKTCNSPQEAGEFIKQKLQPGAVVLLKGSQNGVFAEEAVKVLLADRTDEAKLVRQSPHWLAVKRKQFPSG
jgi:UDP-N-acetylmuramoyl-tripeptide--D-alanyl-D-alanine ligase